MLSESIRWRQLGVSCIPTKGKHYDMKMINKRGYYRLGDVGLPTKDDLICWFGSGRRNLAIITGKVICVDFDSLQSYYQFYALCRPLNRTFTVKTRRGYHFYYFLDEPVNKPFEITWPDTELKHSGQAIVTAGAGYEISDNGLLSKYTMLKLASVYALPFVEPVTPTKNIRETANYSFRGCHGSITNPIKTIKSNLSISQYLSDLGHELKPLPNNRYITNCPVHDDEKPSFWIDENTRTCNCYRDDCKRAKSYDVLDLHQKLNNCDLNTAIKELANSLGF